LSPYEENVKNHVVASWAATLALVTIGLPANFASAAFVRAQAPLIVVPVINVAILPVGQFTIDGLRAAGMVHAGSGLVYPGIYEDLATIITEPYPEARHVWMMEKYGRGVVMPYQDFSIPHRVNQLIGVVDSTPMQDPSELRRIGYDGDVQIIAPERAAYIQHYLMTIARSLRKGFQGSADEAAENPGEGFDVSLSANRSRRNDTDVMNATNAVDSFMKEEIGRNKKGRRFVPYSQWPRARAEKDQGAAAVEMDREPLGIGTPLARAEQGHTSIFNDFAELLSLPLRADTAVGRPPVYESMREFLDTPVTQVLTGLSTYNRKRFSYVGIKTMRGLLELEKTERDNLIEPYRAEILNRFHVDDANQFPPR
jgi:hypothetical protein